MTKTLLWDEAGNISFNGEAWDYNGLNQLISRPGVNYQYDANGNQTQTIRADGILQFNYDVEDRLTRVSDGNDITIADYAYDPFGRRLWKRTATEEIYFLYDESGLVAEFNSSGDIIKTYGYHPYASFITEPFFLKEGNDYYYYINNYLYAPIGLRNSAGQIVWSAEYDELGKATETLTLVDNPLRYPGQYEDKETGLHYNFQRYYDPETSRYNRLDPLGMEEGFNQYAYVDGDPINRFDPNGEAAFLIPIAKGLICMAIDAAISGCAPTLGSTALCFLGPGPIKRLPKIPGCNSFIGETLVHTETGLKAIEDIEIGEKVLSFAEWDGSQFYSPVDDVFTGEREYELVQITFADGDSLETTLGHPFWIKGNGWRTANLLQVGDLVQIAESGYREITELERSSRIEQVYNLSVAKSNTFYVDEEPLLVHNAKKCRKVSSGNAGDKVDTPDTKPEDFINMGNRQFKNKKTSETFTQERVGRDHRGEKWDVTNREGTRVGDVRENGTIARRID